MATPAAPIHLVLDNTFGALLIGVLISAALWGVTCIQTFIYYMTYPGDELHLKIIVALAWIFDTIHQILICHTAYTYLVTNFGNLEFLGVLVNTLVIEVFFTAFIALLVQCFFAMRVWILSSKNIIITSIVMAFVLSEFGAVMAYGIKGVNFTTLADLSKLKALSISVNALAAAGDIVIAATLCWLLHTSRTGFKRSDGMITKMIAFCVNTGLITSLCAIASLVTIVALPNAFVYIAFYFALGRLYSNSLLATLNARQALRNASRQDDISMSGGRGHTFSRSEAPRAVSIKVDTTRQVDYSDHDTADDDYKHTPSNSSIGEKMPPPFGRGDMV
ncbi:hypothetical protein SISNIDRAFT_452320 [Sistotremastrum niveocremeum HHB9708]|uniref:DUF6534 domain-containing protein n=1 Tax=Sistotremastrum niveocremeum HHB9708 TaxID=1314777 RepID=A0A164X632_9AGAM|nr:hypothetical protein SISNIDRAFT_452320 [Sistotremastrum niveocremeum HHB9708]